MLPFWANKVQMFVNARKGHDNQSESKQHPWNPPSVRKNMAPTDVAIPRKESWPNSSLMKLNSQKSLGERQTNRAHTWFHEMLPSLPCQIETHLSSSAWGFYTRDATRLNDLMFQVHRKILDRSLQTLGVKSKLNFSTSLHPHFS